MENKDLPAFPIVNSEGFPTLDFRIEKHTTMGLTKREYFAGIAMQALIAKLPLADREGKFSEPYSQEEIDNLRKHICASAISYSDNMLSLLSTPKEEK